MALASDLVQKGFSAQRADFLGEVQSDALTATGNNLATAFALIGTLNKFTTTALNTGAALPLASTSKHQRIFVRNDGANPLTVYAQTGDTVAGGASNSVLAARSATYYLINSTTWVV